MSDMHSPRHAWKQLSKGTPMVRTMSVFVDMLQNYRWIVGQFALKHRALANWYHILLSILRSWRGVALDDGFSANHETNFLLTLLTMAWPGCIVIWLKKNKPSPKSPSIGGTNYSQMGCLFCFNHISFFVCALNGSPTRWACRSHSLTVVHVA